MGEKFRRRDRDGVVNPLQDAGPFVPGLREARRAIVPWQTYGLSPRPGYAVVLEGSDLIALADKLLAVIAAFEARDWPSARRAFAAIWPGIPPHPRLAGAVADTARLITDGLPTIGSPGTTPGEVCEGLFGHRPPPQACSPCGATGNLLRGAMLADLATSALADAPPRDRSGVGSGRRPRLRA